MARMVRPQSDGGSCGWISLCIAGTNGPSRPDDLCVGLCSGRASVGWPALLQEEGDYLCRYRVEPSWRTTVNFQGRCNEFGRNTFGGPGQEVSPGHPRTVHDAAGVPATDVGWGCQAVALRRSEGCGVQQFLGTARRFVRREAWGSDWRDRAEWRRQEYSAEDPIEDY